MLKTQLMWRVRSHLHDLVIDDSLVDGSLEGSWNEFAEVAIYALSDPRDIREARYIGQTTHPHRRYVQHIAHAKLWLPDEIPWWIKKPKMRPLYEWIRTLYRDECRLPVMVVQKWTLRSDALHRERELIHDYLQLDPPLLNHECDELRAALIADCKPEL